MSESTRSNPQHVKGHPGGMSAGRVFTFDGGAATYVGTGLLAFLITIFTAGIALPFALVLRHRWQAKHTFVDGRRLRFTGTGLGLFGQWLKWLLLVVVTLGIYSFWVAPRLTKWIVEHQEFEMSDPSIGPKPFSFDGGAGSYLGVGILSFLLTVFTLGLAAPWATVMRMRWQAEHTILAGRRLRFAGTGGRLFVKWIKWFLLTLLTVGIYSFWLVPRVTKWTVEHQEI